MIHTKSIRLLLLITLAVVCAAFFASCTQTEGADMTESTETSGDNEETPAFEYDDIQKVVDFVNGVTYQSPLELVRNFMGDYRMTDITFTKDGEAIPYAAEINHKDGITESLFSDGSAAFVFPLDDGYVYTVIRDSNEYKRASSVKNELYVPGLFSDIALNVGVCGSADAGFFTSAELPKIDRSMLDYNEDGKKVVLVDDNYVKDAVKLLLETMGESGENIESALDGESTCTVEFDIKKKIFSYQISAPSGKHTDYSYTYEFNDSFPAKTTTVRVIRPTDVDGAEARLVDEISMEFLHYDGTRPVDAQYEYTGVTTWNKTKLGDLNDVYEIMCSAKGKIDCREALNTSITFSGYRHITYRPSQTVSFSMGGEYSVYGSIASDDEGRRISCDFSGKGLPSNGRLTAEISFGEFETDYDADAVKKAK